MAFFLSPGVYVREIDLTTIIPSVSTSIGAFAGSFVWGPANAMVLLSNEQELVKTFGRPDNDTFKSFFTVANFLSYSNAIQVVRAIDVVNAKNAVANTDNNATGLLIENRSEYEINYLGLPPASNVYGMFAARYPGDIGNSLKVSLFAESGADPSLYEEWGVNEARPYYEEFDGPPGTSLYAAKNGGANDEMHIIVVDREGKFTKEANTVLEKFSFVSKAVDAKNDDGSSNYYVNVVNDRSRYIYILNHAQINNPAYKISTISIGNAGNSYSNGFISITGGSGRYARANISVNVDGSIVFANVINTGIGYLSTDTVTANAQALWSNNGNSIVASLTVNLALDANKDHAANSWGLPANSRSFTQTKTFYESNLAKGVDGYPTNGDLQLAYDKFKNAEEVDISLVMTGGAPQTVSEYVIENIADYRKDCVAFISPEYSDVVDNVGYEVDDIKEYRDKFNSTSYAVLDNNWKYQFDKYNNVYRWVPLNGDIAGLCARTDDTRDPWYSPAGLNRGFIKNVVKLAWNADKTDRDALYPYNINPVVSFPGEGVVLFGDKTMQFKPSAFDRINVRRLFIVLEKAIARAARYSLFEFNDEFTRAQFVALVEPFLRDVQGRRGIFDFRVVCDTTNNTPEVIDRNEFIGDIYIKPARSINFIQLNFIAVRTGVAFEEVVGKWG